ncbi:unnamed protein product [Protopolystoma xenopodis]|uniref:Uncharacterized protein n=1 Tax=Protopolystoma xenopodis TaxID=117903 RepID=A0A3S5BT43_9PLAT|nr:unnamed protein product [Protopolystoma xenopodis]
MALGDLEQEIASIASRIEYPLYNCIDPLIQTIHDTCSDQTELTELMERLGICSPSRADWKDFMNKQLVERYFLICYHTYRYASIFGRTLVHLFWNLGLEPPDGLADNEMDADTTGHSLSPCLGPSLPQLQSPQTSGRQTGASHVTKRAAARQSLPRALFTDPVVIPIAKASLIKSTPATSFGHKDVHDSSSRRTIQTNLQLTAPQLVLISRSQVTRSRRKMKTPKKCTDPRKRHPSGGRSSSQRRRFESGTSPSSGRGGRSCTTVRSPRLNLMRQLASSVEASPSRGLDVHELSPLVGSTPCQASASKIRLQGGSGEGNGKLCRSNGVRFNNLFTLAG